MMKIIKRLKCYLKGHKFTRFRAPIDMALSWHGWIEWSGIKCSNGCGIGRRRKNFKQK